MGIFAKRLILKHEELTFNYNVDRYGYVRLTLCFSRSPSSWTVFGRTTAMMGGRFCVVAGYGRFLRHMSFLGIRHRRVSAVNPIVWDSSVARRRRMLRRWMTSIWMVSHLVAGLRSSAARLVSFCC